MIKDIKKEGSELEEIIKKAHEKGHFFQANLTLNLIDINTGKELSCIIPNWKIQGFNKKDLIKQISKYIDGWLKE